MVLDVFYGAEEPAVAQYWGLQLCRFGVMEIVLWCLLLPEPEGREARDCRGWGTVTQEVAWVESSRAGVLWQLQIPSQHEPGVQGRAASLSVRAKLCSVLQKRAAAPWNGPAAPEERHLYK